MTAALSSLVVAPTLITNDTHPFKFSTTVKLSSVHDANFEKQSLTAL